MDDKSSLRKHFIELLKKQGSQQRLDKSRNIAAQLFQLPAFVKARTVMFYASLPSEVETFAMMQQAIQQHKRIALPVIDENHRTMVPLLTTTLEELVPGPLGILQPNPANAKPVGIKDLDAVIVPGLAFDQQHHRLGRGAGFYDRFLAQTCAHTTTIGVAFDFQVVDCLPKQEHDIALDCIIAA